jgi:rod shape-determining protein MreD
MIPSLLVPWVPALTVLLAVALQNLALPWHFWGVLRPDFVLLCLLYWRLYRPDRCGPGIAFVAGVATDVLAGTPLGLHALTNMVVVLVTGYFGTRLRSADFLFLLPMIVPAVLIREMFHGMILNLFQNMPMHWPPFLGRVMATVLLTPMVIRILIHLHRVWLEEAQHAG